jgi:flavodoxin
MMNIKDYILGYTNYPIIFMGTGISLRYLKVAYSWDQLLKKIANDLYGSKEKYYDIKSENGESNHYRYDKISTIIEDDFNKILKKPEERNGRYKDINDIFYRKMEENINISRFKIHIAQLLANDEIKDDVKSEIDELVRAKKNICSIITTNYDTFIEKALDFIPIIGNDIFFSNPYGAVYKIHGSITQPADIIINENDYSNFKEKNELINSQLVSLFIHQPIIFMGYNVGDDDIKNVLKTVFKYVDRNSPLAEKIQNNFLLVEYEKDSANTEISDYDIEMTLSSSIRIKKLKTDNFIEIYKSISSLQLPISVMDIRKVKNVIKDIETSGTIKVYIAKDLDSLNNSEKVLAIGDFTYTNCKFIEHTMFFENYFSMISDSKVDIIKMIDKLTISDNQYFPIFGYATKCHELTNVEVLKEQQKNLIVNYYTKQCIRRENAHTDIPSILNDTSIPKSYKYNALMYSVYNDQISLDEFKLFLEEYSPKRNTSYRHLLSFYDYKKYACETS